MKNQAIVNICLELKRLVVRKKFSDENQNLVEKVIGKNFMKMRIFNSGTSIPRF